MAASIKNKRQRIAIIQSDLSQFYDRVRPEVLASQIELLREPQDDPAFFDFAASFLRWHWHEQDTATAQSYSQGCAPKISGFGNVALPQGLVAAGFFANVALLSFDDALRQAIGTEIKLGIKLEDACRYVDDLRFVVSCDSNKDLSVISKAVVTWLQRTLRSKAPGQEVSIAKTTAAIYRGDEKPLLLQSRRMRRIQGAISGGFGIAGGIEILDSIAGLVRSQDGASEQEKPMGDAQLAPIPDVKDSTVARFSANRFRTTFRSLRPLLDSDSDLLRQAEEDLEAPSPERRYRRSREDLDDDARTFSYGLVERWTKDPSNVRLLLIGLDLWPASDLLEHVLRLIRPYAQAGAHKSPANRVALYCLAEVFRAGAVETGLVGDDEALPDRVDLKDYRDTLRKEALRLLNLPASTLPWYLKQQILLFLASATTLPLRVRPSWESPETTPYCDLMRFLNGQQQKLPNTEFALLSIVARRSILDKKSANRLIRKQLTSSRLRRIARRDPGFATELIENSPRLAHDLGDRITEDLCIAATNNTLSDSSLASATLGGNGLGKLRNELMLLKFASQFLRSLGADRDLEVITPANVFLSWPSEDSVRVKLRRSKTAPSGSIYRPPRWCPAHQRWRFQLGYLLRFILAESPDFTRVSQPNYKRERPKLYRPSESLWYQRRYSFFNEQTAFGDDWLPISEWVENLLFALLSWPGCRPSAMGNVVRSGLRAMRRAINARIDYLLRVQGRDSPLLLPIEAPDPEAGRTRPLRACIVQTSLPSIEDFEDLGPALDDKALRRRHRSHLSAAIEAVKRMLALRETHKSRDGRLDLLVLPELSVHPADVHTHLVPFARQHKTIVLAGLTYEKLIPGAPYTNSAIWIIPTRSPSSGLQLLTRRQGKQHLAPIEDKFYNSKQTQVHGFRPCQWIVQYCWSPDPAKRPLNVSAAICYDATDLHLATLLRGKSDLFVIPALNKDVNTFDQMAAALHYHMFQMVIVANSGLFGGSNAYAPYDESFKRQVFHLHGQPQASIAFVEIDSIEEFIRRKEDAKNPNSTSTERWKYPPAGL